MVHLTDPEFAGPVVRIVSSTRPVQRLSERGSGGGGFSGKTPSTDVFTASWCCSVGMTWTMELRSVDRGAQGRPAEWICSGVPTQQPVPERQTVHLLRERGLLLFPVDSADSIESPPRTRSRRLIGYVTRNPELMQLALMLAQVLDECVHRFECAHPMIVAARWMQYGYTADAALRWVAAGVTVPEAARIGPIRPEAARIGPKLPQSGPAAHPDRASEAHKHP